MPDYSKMTDEQIRAELVKRDEQLATATQHLETATKLNSDNSERIKSLEEHNQKLFLKVTTKVEDKQDEDQKPEKRTFEGLIKKMEGKE